MNKVMASALAALLLAGCMTGGEDGGDGGAGKTSGTLSAEAAAGSWELVGTLSGAPISSVRDWGFAFVNETVGYLCVGSAPGTNRKQWITSTDAGKTWTGSPVDTTSGIEKLFGMGNSLVFAQMDFFVKKASGGTTTLHRVARSSDAGVSWTFITVEGDSSLDDFEAQSNGVLWVRKSKAKYYSLDTGANWKKFDPGPTIESHLFEGYYLLDDTKGTGAFFASVLDYDIPSDGYSKKTVSGLTQMQGLSIFRTGWGVAGGFLMNSATGFQTPVLAQTRDGREWKTFRGEGNGFLSHTALIGEKTGMAFGVIGANGLLSFRSEDGGGTWKKVPAEGIPMLIGLSCPSERICFGYAYTNAIYKYSR